MGTEFRVSGEGGEEALTVRSGWLAVEESEIVMAGGKPTG